jgi:1A family penicillin-binding protein
MLTRHPRTWRWIDWGVAVLLIVLAIVGSAVVYWTGTHTLAVRRLQHGVGDTTFLAADGRPWFRMDEQRQDVKLAEISPHLRNAVIAVEDHRFRKHIGIDPIGLGRAVVTNVRTDGRQGGSTITQQLARTLFLSNQKTYGRKAREAALALMLEQQLTKDQILELYLNRVYLSSGVYGVEPLSRRLFGKPAKDVTLAEAALVAGLIRAPSALSPWSNLEDARERSRVVLARMREEGYIDEAQEKEARGARLRVRPYSLAVEAKGGYVKEYLRQQFRNRFGGDHPPDWQVRTTVLPEIQEAAERAVTANLKKHGIRNLQAALVALDPATGDVLAMVGGSDFRATTYNRATRSRRQPGSAFKPLVFAAALERGWSPVSMLGGLAAIREIGDEEWSPRNDRGEAVEAIILREALVDSNNQAAVALQNEIGTRTVLRLASDVGLHGQPDVRSLALGTGLVTPLEMARVYAMFPNGGFDVAPRAIVTVLDANGGVVLEQGVERRPVISPQTAYQMVSLLRDVVDRGTAQNVRAQGVRFPVGGKTGTTNAFKDAWFVGFSSSMVVAVWVGLDQPATMGNNAYGSRLAVPIWTDFMRATSRLRRPEEFRRPPGLQAQQLCRVSYRRPVEGCPTYTEYLKRGDEVPGGLCEVHRGSLGQRVQRATEGALGRVWGRIKGVFR